MSEVERLLKELSVALARRQAEILLPDFLLVQEVKYQLVALIEECVPTFSLEEIERYIAFLTEEARDLSWSSTIRSSMREELKAYRRYKEEEYDKNLLDTLPGGGDYTYLPDWFQNRWRLDFDTSLILADALRKGQLSSNEFLLPEAEFRVAIGKLYGIGPKKLEKVIAARKTAGDDHGDKKPEGEEA